MSKNRLKFIEANEPMPKLAARYFIEKYKDRISENIADFRNIVAFLPTRGAAKNLKESITLALFKKGVKNILALNICTYEDYVAKFATSEITKLENYSIWLSILLNCDFSLINGLLPSPENISRKEVLYIAKEIIFLQEKLNEDLLSIKDASENFIDKADSKRWQDLAWLEELYSYKIKDLGKISQLESKLNAMEKASNSEIEDFLIIGNPDISKALKFFVEKTENKSKNLEIVAFAKPEDKELFDSFGAPKDLEYSSKALSINEANLFPCASPKDEAILIDNLAKSYGEDAEKILGISCEQKETALLFQDSLKNLKTIALEANKLSKTSIFDLLKNIKAFLEESSFDIFRNLCLNSYVVNYLKEQGENLQDALNQLDAIKEKTATKDVYALKILLKNESLKNLIDFLLNIDIYNLEEKILKLLGSVKEEDEVAALELFQSSLDVIFFINENFDLSFNLDEVFIILFEALEGKNIKSKNSKDSIILQDWMEIFWSKSAHILLCDMNDGIVPLRENNGLFLNDSIRKTLSMRTQKIRQARDAYMLETLISTRAKESYGISILLAQRNMQGELLVPSRILFQCKKEDIANRVKFLFREISPKSSENLEEKDWNLKVETKKFEGNFSVSRFNTYLNSPWLFYLQNVLKMNIVDSSKEELSPADFGNIYHEILEKFGKSKIKNSENSKEIFEFFLKTLDGFLFYNFKNTQRAQVAIQLEDLKSRLYYTAIEQVRHRKEGWEILYVEEKFKNYKLADGVLLNGVFDRIDYHKDFGYLIIDYKTKDKAKENIVQESHCDIDKKTGAVKAWKNLQIPIYLEVFENLELKINTEANVKSAYFCATKDADSTKIYHWENAKDYVEEAKNIALEIAEKVKNSEFFDFEKEDKYNNFGSVFKLDFAILKDKVKLV